MEKGGPSYFFVEGNSRCKNVDVMGWMALESFKQVTAIGMYRLVGCPREAHNSTNLFAFVQKSNKYIRI